MCVHSCHNNITLRSPYSYFGSPLSYHIPDGSKSTYLQLMFLLYHMVGWHSSSIMYTRFDLIDPLLTFVTRILSSIVLKTILSQSNCSILVLNDSQILVLKDSTGFNLVIVEHAQLLQVVAFVSQILEALALALVITINPGSEWLSVFIDLDLYHVEVK